MDRVVIAGDPRVLPGASRRNVELDQHLAVLRCLGRSWRPAGRSLRRGRPARQEHAVFVPDDVPVPADRRVHVECKPGIQFPIVVRARAHVQRHAGAQFTGHRDGIRQMYQSGRLQRECRRCKDLHVQRHSQHVGKREWHVACAHRSRIEAANSRIAHDVLRIDAHAFHVRVEFRRILECRDIGALVEQRPRETRQCRRQSCQPQLYRARHLGLDLRDDDAQVGGATFLQHGRTDEVAARRRGRATEGHTSNDFDIVDR